jgi:hypothetical protein
VKSLKAFALLGISSAAIVLLPQPALAVNTTCANRQLLLSGTSASVSIPASSSLFYGVPVVAGRSYAVLAWQPFNDASIVVGPTDIAVFSNGTCSTSVTLTDVEDHEPYIASITGTVDLEAQSFIAAGSGEYVVQVSNAAASAITHRVVIFETTIYSPWWYTGGSNQAFITLSNHSNFGQSVTVTMNGSTGTQCQAVTTTVAANGNTFLRVNDYASCVSAGYGSAQISALAAPGSIQANTTVLDVVQGVSFDEPFVPRSNIVVTER